MQNTNAIIGSDYHNVLLVGTAGSGKTSQFRTMPGRGFIFVFDPNALASLKGTSIDYEAFLPDRLDINVHPLSSKRGSDEIIKASEPVAYVKFEEFFQKFMAREGHIKDYDWTGFDSLTTFADSVMDRVQWLNERLGKQPERTDWSAQMMTIQNVFRWLSSRSKLLICTAHEELIGEEQAKRLGEIIWQPVMTGRLRTRLPLLFSDIFRCHAERGQYLFQTKVDQKHPYIRTSIQNLEEFVDMTIPPEEFDPPASFEHGLGFLLREAGYLDNLKAPLPSAAKRARASGEAGRAKAMKRA